MTAAIALALIASLSSLVVAFWSARQSRSLERLKAELAHADRDEERLYDTAAELDRHRQLFLTAAHGLGERLENIRFRGFLGNLCAGPHRSRNAVLGTPYRVGHYLARVETLHANVDLTRAGRDDQARAVDSHLAAVGRAFSSDVIDGFPTREFLVWPDEQRAIGERMRPNGDGPTENCVGSATLVERLDDVYAPCFASMVDDLRAPGAEASPRLRRIQDGLAWLVEELDDQRRYVRLDEHGMISEPPWVARVVAVAGASA